MSGVDIQPGLGKETDLEPVADRDDSLEAELQAQEMILRIRLESA
jgi:hypothetical protein